MTRNILIAVLGIAMSAARCGDVKYPVDDHILFHRSAVEGLGDDAELVVTRQSTVHERHALNKRWPIWQIKDEVRVLLFTDRHERGVELWSRSHTSSRDAVQWCDRLIVYDVNYEGQEVSVLYSIGCEVRIDLIAMDGDGRAVSAQTMDVVTQIDSGVLPYLIDAGRIVRDENGIFVVFRTFGSTSSIRGRDHPYELWVIEGDEVEEVEDLLGHHRMQNVDLDQLHDGLPTYREQIQRPAIPNAAD